MSGTRSDSKLSAAFGRRALLRGAAAAIAANGLIDVGARAEEAPRRGGLLRFALERRAAPSAARAS
jgi:hypothetical protein